MQATEDRVAVPAPTPRKRWWRRRWFLVTVSIALIVCAGFVAATEYVLHNAEPIIRRRVVETLAAHFHTHVELDALSISLLKGIEVEGSGLRIGRVEIHDEPGNQPSAPMLSVDHFSFRTRVESLLHQPTRVASVSVEGMQIHVPPPGQRADMLHWDNAPGENHHAKVDLLVRDIHAANVTLFIVNGKPGKEPLRFDIQRLDLHDVGAGKPFAYVAELTNPKPTGQIRAEGHFGPWNSDDPRSTALDGSYTFDHADLNTIKGLGGILSSKGQFSGVLDHVTVDGATETPDFSLDISQHSLPLHTDFHAYVDGTTGDTTLDPVHARLAQSSFTCRGKVVKIKHKGHDITMDVEIPNGRMQDFLRLATKTNPPLMNAVLNMHAKMHIAPGEQRVPERMDMSGEVDLHDVRFNNPKIQDKVDGLSARAQGNPREVKEVSTDRQAEVSSRLSANFHMGNGVMFVRDIRYQIPGALVLLNGVYSMDGRIFDFKGHVRTDATASQMVTGWKSWLLKPVDKFLSKNGAGLELPIAVSGTEGDVRFGLAMHGASQETDKEMMEDLHQRRLDIQADKRERRAEKLEKQQQERADGMYVGERDGSSRESSKGSGLKRRAPQADGDPR